jgi:hypothetical protein
MTVRSTHLKLIGAAGAAALTITAMASPALAAGEETASVAYSCATPLGPATPSADYAVDAPPASMVAGQTVKLPTSATFTLDAGTTLLAEGLGWTKFDGTIKTPAGLPKVGLAITIPETTLGNGPGGSTVANATGKTLLRPTSAGTLKLVLGDIGKVTLNGSDANGPVGSVSFPNSDGSFGRCKNTAGTTPLQNSSAQDATVAVTKDKSKTATTAKYNAKRNVAKGTAKVRGATFGLIGTGKVKFILKRGTHKIKAITDTLNKKGVASVKFKHVSKKGKYSIIAKYSGDKGLKRSSGKDTFRVR